MLRLRPRVRQNSIWCFDGQGEVATRRGRASIDPAERFYDETDIDRPLHANGLNVRDFAVFVDYLRGQEVVHEMGYLVTHVYEDSGSVLVPGDLIIREPDKYLNSNLANRLSFVSPEAFAEFSIEAIAELLAARQKPQQ
jgi:hypothetical protein